MEICKRCKLAKKCGASSESDVCLNYEPRPQTHYDLLISKTPEELAMFFQHISECESCFIHSNECGRKGYPCNQRFLEWLKSPVEVEE